MKILVLDNYDSFTYNIVHLLKEITNEPIDIFRNDEITLDEVGQYDKIMLSPGPGIPDEAGILKEVIRKYASTKSIFGVCLGCQAIAEVFGGKLINLDKVYHGVSTPVSIVNEKDITFHGVPTQFDAGRYHSWVVDGASLPSEIEVSASEKSGQVMALFHKEYDVRGVQFHPESVLTPYGKEMLTNWVQS